MVAMMRISLLIVLMMLLAGCGEAPAPTPTPPAPVRVFAAASLTDVLGELAHDEALELNLASSSTLAKQIEAGADFDVFISANEQWMDAVEKAGLLRPGSRIDLLRNRLAVIRPKGGAATLGSDFTGRLAVGDPAHVPAGIYAKQALDKLGLHPQLLPGEDVRAALRYVELGEAELGIVYATDARASDKVEIVELIDESLHDPVVYPAALAKGASPTAERWFEHLCGDTARAVFQGHGFDVAGRSEP